MSQYEVIVRSVTETSYLVEARNSADARAKWATGVEGASIVDQEDVLRVTNLADQIQWDEEEDY